jgi:uncharacterized protein (TIGR00661 family)
MKILFGIQGTGNGHISRSKEIVKELLKSASVDVLLSGTQHEVDVDFDIKYNYQGLGFTFGKRGGIDYLDSFRTFNPYKLISDVRGLPVRDYDLVITDFEPVTAWACKAKGVPCVSISHQAALLSPKTPRPGGKNRFQEWVLKWYAPGTSLIGLHFKEYDSFIKTPIIRREMRNTEVKNKGHYTVYLPSFDDKFLCRVLKSIDVPWEVFSKHHKGESYRDGNVRVFAVDSNKFVESFSSCEGIITNAGFETPSEALYFGKKLLVIPMKRQYEQQCNAEALKRLGIKVVYSIGSDFEKVVADWIESTFIYHAEYGNNLPELAEMILEHAINRTQGEQPLEAKEIDG